MRELLVCDASVLVALLLDDGPDGRWAADALTGSELAAPSLAAFEIANILRRHELAGRVSIDAAAQAHADLLALAVEYWPYEALAVRSWQLRTNLTTDDASYVALAEMLDVPLLTLDRRLASSPGPRCLLVTPPG